MATTMAPATQQRGNRDSSRNISLCGMCIIMGKARWLTVDLKLLNANFKKLFLRLKNINIFFSYMSGFQVIICLEVKYY